MARNYVTDIRHFVDQEEKPASGVAAKLWGYFGLIVEIGSTIVPGHGFVTPMLCGNPLRRARCEGRLAVGLVADHEVIWWECNVCSEGGSISNWQGTRWDLREIGPVALATNTIDAVLPPVELATLRRLEIEDRVLRRLLAGAGYLSEEYAGFWATRVDIKKLQEAVERAAATATGRAGVRDRRILDRLAGRLDALTVRFEDFEGIEQAQQGEEAEPDGDQIVALAADFAVRAGRDEPTREDMDKARLTLLSRGKPRLH